MKNILRDNIAFLVPYLALLLSVLPFLLVFPKGDIHLWMNSYNSNFSDFFFRIITFMGDGVFVCMAGVLFLFISFRSSVLILSSYLFSGLIVQIFKRFVFTNSPRPSVFFEHYGALHVVQGVEMHGSGSFPSGHSASAFALFLILAMITKDNRLKVLCLPAATAVAFSRVYLSQHFLMDVYAGSIIGVASAVLVYRLMTYRPLNWYNHSLSGLLKKNRNKTA